QAARAAQGMTRVTVIDGGALDPRRVPRRHAIEQAHRAAMRDQRFDAGVVEAGRRHRFGSAVTAARSTVAKRSTFANGVPACIGSLSTAKPSSARRDFHAASVLPGWPPKPWPGATLQKSPT